MRKFSIVIPTRNRHETLPFAIRSCLKQEFDNFEVLVSDNSSNDESMQVVEGLANKRLRYVRTSKSLSMSVHWEFALSHVEADYVILIGDDDALLPSTLAAVDAILSQTGDLPVRWDWSSYFWPGCPIGENRLTIPLSGTSKIHEYELSSARQVLDQVVRGVRQYSDLPMLYNSAIPVSLIEAIRRGRERYLCSACPDIYSGIAFAAHTSSYASVRMPLGILGVSGKSNGAAHMRRDGESSVALEFQQLNNDQGTQWNPCVPNVPAVEAAVGECVETFNSNYPQFKVKHSIRNTKRIAFQAIMRGNYESEILRDYLTRIYPEASEAKLAEWSAIAETRGGSANESPEPSAFVNQTFELDASRVGIQCVEDAVQFVNRFYNFDKSKLKQAHPTVGSLQAKDFVPPALWRLLSRTYHCIKGN